MKYKKLGDKFIIRLDKGDEIISSLKAFSQKENLIGFFFGIGATDNVEIAYFDPKKKKYFSKRFEKGFEISSLIGNIVEDGTIHAHITLGSSNYNAYTGHLNSGIISVTCEIIFLPLDGKLGRKHVEEFDLNLLNI